MAGEQRSLLLTGASRGIGHATVKRFMQDGWHIITVSRQPFAKVCPWPGGGENHIELNLADLDGVARALARIRDRLPDGKLHALVNNAAISPKGPGGKRLGTLDTELALWQQVFNVNFFATIVLAQGLKDELVKAQGTIINVTSIAGSRVHPFAGSAYATSKAALAALTREFAGDFGRLGVRVNAIAPGEIDTAILSPGTETIVQNDIPMHRLGTPEEVANTIFFLCSPASSYINGAEIHINGGQHI
jgi:NAD(P)-dependent dehydrogenase (short-subunit alcohol dehydrogenase family)